MKRLSFILIFTFVFVWAFEFNAEGWGSYLTFDPDKRESLLSYPVSWLRPSAGLFEHDYQDSSSSFGLWEQILSIDETLGYTPGMSNHIIAKYTPYSFPYRWSAGLEFLNYKGANSTYRTDALLHYRTQKGNIEYFHTSNTQKIKLTSGETTHLIRAHGLNVDYSISNKLELQAGININLIDQKDASETRNYNIHHEQIALNYSFLNAFSTYGKFHYWYWNNIDREGPAWLFYPGIRYNGKWLKSHASLRVASSSIYPIFEISLHPGPLYIHAFTKVRSSRLDLRQSANQYYGIRSGLNVNSLHHTIDASLAYTYDVVRTLAADTLINSDFQSFRANAEYKFKTKHLDVYVKENYQHAIDPREGYYNPVRSILTGGLSFRSGLAKGKLLLNGDLNAQYILHDDPDMVSFDPSTLIYTLNGSADLVSDWKINAKLKAIIQSFAISADVSIPVKFTYDLNYFFYEGISTSSDFYIGNAFYTGLTIEWLWWK